MASITSVMFLNALLVILVPSFLLPPEDALPAKTRSSGPDSSRGKKIVIARVADREITLHDFIQRSEYTIRAPYCRGTSNNDKNIILNTLIAEKLLSLEAGKDNELLNDERLKSFIAGRREQKMRSLLYHDEGERRVSLDTNETKKMFSLAGRTYRIQYFAVRDKSLADALAARFTETDSAFDRILSFFRGDAEGDSIPERTVDWFSPEIDVIHKSLFSDKLMKGQLIGPVCVNDTTILFIKVKGWTERVAISETDIGKRYNDVVERLTIMKADSIYDKFILAVMGDRRVDFDASVFNKLVKLVAPFYVGQREDAKDAFPGAIFDGNELPDWESLGNNYDEIRNMPILTIDGVTWTVADLKKEIDKHPLVFRRRNARDAFAKRLRLAIVDLIRDKYLTDVAYQRGYHRDEIVAHDEQSWLDASVALFQRDEYLRRRNVHESSLLAVIEKHLNPYIRDLLRRYSDRIEINVEEYGKIRLTKTDMFTTQSDVPYRIYVPAFPQLTTHNRLDYGRKMANNN